ncbi:MAG: hypothetical protein V7L04_22110 [Nostoc sp.]|uniref:hypothetical protein n=1 Tax=Nostoc sp. TaxID=1180 RepID=UPI002FFC40B8
MSTYQNHPEQPGELLQLWKERLAFLEREQAIVASSIEQFELRKRIEDCLKKILELEAKINDGNISADWKKEYSLPAEICKNQDKLLKYLEKVIPKLREEFGFLDIKNNVKYDNNNFKFIARKRSFDMSISIFNFRGEAFFIFAEFYQLTIDSLREFRGQCLKYAEKTAESDTKFWKPIYDFRLPNNLCFSIAFVDKLDAPTRQKVLTENPLRYSLNALWYSVPVVYELNSERLYFYEKPTDWVDQFTGEIAWKELRQITKKTLLP